VGVELIQDNYVTTENQDQIGRTEDVYLGDRLRASFGWAAPELGSDRSAGIYSVSGEIGRPLFKNDILQLSSSWNGRLESGSTVDSVLDAGARYYHRFNEKNLFVAELGAAHAHALDLDQQLQLGGDNGLRGYPLRYQTGDTRVLATVEERYFTDWFPWRLFRVGGAVFADVGRMWGEAPVASEPLGWLSDVGFGLRIGNARSGLDNVLHIDLAFPLGAPGDIDSMQVLIQAEKSF
jgi:hemolysin activation/secretion protein